MPLSETAIKNAIAKAFLDVIDQETDPKGAIDTLAGHLASAVVDAIKSMQITYTTGLVDSMGPVTGTFGYTIT